MTVILLNDPRNPLFTSETISRERRERFAPNHGEKVGDAMAARIEGLLKVKGGSGCGCSSLAQKMNGWGIKGCEKRRNEIVGALVANRDILVKSLHGHGGFLGHASGLAVEFLPDLVLKQGANWLLDMAIEDVRKSKPESTEKPQSGIPPKPHRKKRMTRAERQAAIAAGAIENRAKSLSSSAEKEGARKARIDRQASMAKHRTKSIGSIGSCFRFGDQPARFVKSSQLQEDILLLLSKIPSDVTAIAGVARSGLSVATMISMYLHLPMITIRQTMHDIVDTGNGWRLGGSKHIDPKRGKILVVDDTVMTGNSIRAIRPLVESAIGPGAIYAAVYVNPLAKLKPDIWAVDLPWPHILEWNVFNSILSPSVAVDFDGILCHDCPAGSDDDGEKYLDFISHAKPLYVPRRCPIPLIVTARIEKYRSETEDWLKRHGIRFNRLVMHPAATLKERRKDNIPHYKGLHFKQWAARHRASPGPVIFMESDDRQAREIAKYSGLMVICPHTAGVY